MQRVRDNKLDEVISLDILRHGVCWAILFVFLSFFLLVGGDAASEALCDPSAFVSVGVQKVLIQPVVIL